jgi:hypothetical protein
MTIACSFVRAFVLRESDTVPVKRMCAGQIDQAAFSEDNARDTSVLTRCLR